MLLALFESIPEINSLSIGALIGFLFLLKSASNIFRQLKNFLEKIWEIEPAESNTIKDFITDAIASFFIVLGLGGLLVLSIMSKESFMQLQGCFRVFPFFAFRCPACKLHSQFSDPCAVFRACVQGIARYKAWPETCFRRIAGNSNSDNHRQVRRGPLFRIQQPCKHLWGNWVDQRVISPDLLCLDNNYNWRGVHKSLL